MGSGERRGCGDGSASLKKKGTGRGLPDRSRRRRPPRRRRAAAVGASSVAGASDGGAGIWQPDGVFVPRAKNERIWGRRKKKQL